jgi:hypothetical protein
MKKKTIVLIFIAILFWSSVFVFGWGLWSNYSLGFDDGIKIKPIPQAVIISTIQEL